ncbi:MAG: Flp pilus assembly complex ATPase component TadA [Rubrobacteraceae bacterium]|nr:Flp pilus assembly complex ATPase component TadA [Rubrobacteraceae bacterium]
MMQKDDPREVGQVLLSLGYINKADLARALAQRLRLDYIDLTESDVDKGVATLVEQKVLRKHGVVPLRLENNRLVVAMSDPTNIFALEDLMMISGYPVTPVIALEEEIQRIHAKVFAISEEVSEFLEEAGKDSVEQDHGEIDLGMDAGPEEAPIIKLVSSILQQAVGDGASDIHIEPQARELVVRMRVDGVLRETMSIPPKLQNGVIARLKIVSNLDIAERRVPQDGRFSVKLGGQKIDLRVASLPTVYGEKVVLRLLDTSNAQVELTALGFPTRVYEKYEEIFRRPYGAILVTGPTGSGKSTTLYATLSELNTPEKNIITVEDPVEYRMDEINQIQTNPKAGLTFASALRSILRADPDILMIGEIRDFETAHIAVEAALTGHLVLATLHTNDAPGALSRLTDMGVEPFLTSSAVDCVIAQRLARRLCQKCKEPVEIEEEILAGIQFPFEHAPGGIFRFHKAVGCGRCGGTGYKGRIGIYELMVVTEKMKDMILRRNSPAEIGRVAQEEGMVRLRDDGLLKAAQGITSIEEVLRTVS